MPWQAEKPSADGQSELTACILTEPFLIICLFSFKTFNVTSAQLRVLTSGMFGENGTDAENKRSYCAYALLSCFPDFCGGLKQGEAASPLLFD